MLHVHVHTTSCGVVIVSGRDYSCTYNSILGGRGERREERGERRERREEGGERGERGGRRK